MSIPPVVGVDLQVRDAHLQQKKEKAPKQEKKKAKKEDKEEAPKKPKEENPLDLLPPSKMIMDEWKRMYSNEKDTRKAMAWFWEQFDPEGYSIWRCDYKYNADIANEMMFKTSNLIGGWFQRLEHMRKYGMGTMIIFGEQGSYSLGGVWVFRGQDVPREMLESADYEVYDLKKMDHTNAEDKLYFDDCLCWDGKLEGKVFADGKVFK